MIQTMSEIIPPGIHGTAEIRHDHPSRFEQLDAQLHGFPLRDRTYTRLLVNGSVMMTNAEFEKRSNSEVVREARGDVLIAGLGIGMILAPILAKQNVAHVTVVEKNSDVIALVEPHMRHAKLEIVKADIFTWPPSSKYDTIYFDIWPDICGDNLEQMDALHRKFRRYRKVGGWMDSWCRNMLRKEARRHAK